MASLNKGGEPRPESANSKHQTQEALEKPLSKNQQKKLRRRHMWEESREERKIKRKEKRHAKAEKKKQELKAKMAAAELQGLDPRSVFQRRSKVEGVRAPVAFVIDNDFHKYMTGAEFCSITSQITRCYSDNRRAPLQAHLVMSDWKGPLLERFDDALCGAYKQWKGVHFTEKDFIGACNEAFELLETSKHLVCSAFENPKGEAMKLETIDGAEPVDQEEPKHKNIIYLTSESPYTICRLEAGTCYVIGGLVDRNREKGLCYTRAKERSVRTAKLPIAEYLNMRSRKVLATNHVVEIMLNWLEFGDWGKAFLDVIPTRKGAQLKEEAEDEAEKAEDENGRPEDGDEEIGDKA